MFIFIHLVSLPQHPHQLQLQQSSIIHSNRHLSKILRIFIIPLVKLPHLSSVFLCVCVCVFSLSLSLLAPSLFLSLSLSLFLQFPTIIFSHYHIPSIFFPPCLSTSLPHLILYPVIYHHLHLQVWDIATGSCRSICPHGDSVVSLRWHDSLPIVTTAALDHIVRVWDARGGTRRVEKMKWK